MSWPVTGPAAVAALLAGVAVLVAGDDRFVARARVRRLLAPGSDSRNLVRDGEARSGHGLARPRPGSATVGVGAAAASVLVAMVGLVVAVGWVGRGPVLAALVPLLFLAARRPLAARFAVRRREREIAAALPRFADLVAACLESGAAPVDAFDVVRRHVGGPLSARLAPVVGALRSGVDPLTVYDSGPRDPVRGLVTALSRAMESGAPLADTVAAVADDQRRRRRWSAEAAARRAGVYAVGPLVVCFLPAFVLLGVVPVVLGVAAEVLGDLS
jgi:pilus assembly protein TadC